MVPKNTPLEIGGLTVQGRVFLAPLAAYTSWPFRRICRRFGAALVTTEVAKASEVLRGGESTGKLILHQPDEHPITAQILSRDPAEAADAAALLAQKGFDIVELNCGCPHRRVVSDGLGGALAASPAKTASVIEAMARAARVPVTAKIRSGPERGKVTAVETAVACEAAGAAAVCLHPRFAQGAASLKPDWSHIAQVKQAVRIPVIGNGGIRFAPDAIRMFEETGCDAVLIGEGALGRPWLFRQIAGLMDTGIEPPVPSHAEMLQVLLEHYEGLVALHGERRGTIIMRKQSCHYARHLVGGKRFNEAAIRASTRAQFMASVEEWLAVK